MPLTFDAPVKDLGREAPVAFLTVFDTPPVLPVALLNVDLSTVSKSADLIVGLGDPLEEIVHIDFQAGPSATKHADILVYSALLYRQYLVPIHSIVVLLRPSAAHSNLNGVIQYAPRPGPGKMEFGYVVVPMWKQPLQPLLTGDLGTVPLAVLAQLPDGVPEAEAWPVWCSRWSRGCCARRPRRKLNGC